GEIMVTLLNTDREHSFEVHRGDRIAQLVVQQVSRARFVRADSLPGSHRGAGGFGSSGGWAAATQYGWRARPGRTPPRGGRTKELFGGSVLSSLEGARARAARGGRPGAERDDPPRPRTVGRLGGRGHRQACRPRLALAAPARRHGAAHGGRPQHEGRHGGCGRARRVPPPGPGLRGTQDRGRVGRDPRRARRVRHEAGRDGRRRARALRPRAPRTSSGPHGGGAHGPPRGALPRRGRPPLVPARRPRGQGRRRPQGGRGARAGPRRHRRRARPGAAPAARPAPAHGPGAPHDPCGPAARRPALRPAAPGPRDHGDPVSLRTVLDRALASQAELDAAAELAVTVESGCTPVSEVRPRELVRVSGVLRSVTVRPREGVRALAAELFDGSGSLTLVFLGRRDVPGIEAGRRLRAEGRVAVLEGVPTIFNPRYELQGAA